MSERTRKAHRSGFVVASVALALAAVALQRSEAPAADQKISAEAKAQAETIFAQRCTTCHGANGKGDGPASAGLTPKPRDYTSAEWQDSVTDEHIAKIIKYGGAAVGKSPMMPANPDLTAKDEVVAGLVEHIRGLKGK